MTLKLKHHKNKFFILILFFFSIIINQYYGNLGAFPMDSFHFFDSGFRVLNGEAPFTDYWLVKGPLLDCIQALFFYLFGTNFQAYVLHASLINSLITIATFFVLKEFELKTTYCFIYSLLLSILAYPSSGTPFIDHHSAFFSLLAIYCLLLGIKNDKKIYLILIPILLIFAFLSKQVPAAYVAISIIIILLFQFIKTKEISNLLYFSISFFSFSLITLLIGKFLGIKFYYFLDQYIFYPQTIGSTRFENLSLSFDILERFIFIIISILPLALINLRNFFKKKDKEKNNQFYIFLIMFFYTISLILHQLLTKNQIFIFFLIPILLAFSHISLEKSKIKNKKIITFVLIFLCIFATYKYHLRYNEGRKFHELQNVNFELAVQGSKISKNLKGLNWITPQFKNNPEEEINIINNISHILKKDKRNKMLITNYPFFSVILDENFFSPSRVYTGDGTTHPIKNNKYAKTYKIFIDNLIKKNNIEVIYVTNVVDDNINLKYLNFDYIDSYKNCFKKISIIEELVMYNLKSCN